MTTLYSSLGLNPLAITGYSVLSAAVLIGIAFYIKKTVKKVINKERIRTELSEANARF